jgi:sorbitol-specific phosphotransferase system component IIBC
MTDFYVFSNYGGKQPNNTAYVKNFIPGNPTALWQSSNYPQENGSTINVITTTSSTVSNVLIRGDLYVTGNIINPSDVILKDNIITINDELTNKLMKIKPMQYSFKDDRQKKIHYGFIAQEFEAEFPELVAIKPDKTKQNLKSINYLEIIPLLVNKVQMMQKEIDELKDKINTNK